MRILSTIALALLSLNALADGRIKDIDIYSDAQIKFSKTEDIATHTFLGNSTGSLGHAAPMSVATAAGLLGVPATAFNLSYTPTVGGNWSVVPANVGDALDNLAARTWINQLHGDVSAGPGGGNQAATVNSVGGASAANVATSVGDTQAATNANTPSTIVKRNASGNFSAGTITATLSGNASTATAFDHDPSDCGAGNFATGIDSGGNLTCSSAVTSVFYQTIQSNGSDQTQRNKLNFSTNFTTTDSSSPSRTTVDLASTITANTSGNAATASALAANPADCSSGQYAKAIAANGDLTCQVVPASDIGSATNFSVGTGLTISAGTGTGATLQALTVGIAAGYYLPTTADQTNWNSKQAAGNYITALTGDGTASGPGSVPFTLATVNGSPGTFGSASQSLTATVNGKGLVTAMSAQNIQIAESQVTNLVSDLAGKQATGNYITGITGDVVATGPGSVSSTIQAGVVTNAKQANMPSLTVKSNITGGAAAPSDNSLSSIIDTMTNCSTRGGVLYRGASGWSCLVPGTSGLVLTSNGVGADPTYQSAGTSSPLTTAGDIYVFSTINDRLPIGTDGQVLTVDTTQPKKMKWASASGGGSGNGYARFILEGAVVPFTAINGAHYNTQSMTLSSVNISALNSGSSGSTTVQVNQYRAGALFDSATASLASASSAPAGASSALGHSLSLSPGDVITVDVTAGAAGASDLAVEWELGAAPTTIGTGNVVSQFRVEGAIVPLTGIGTHYQASALTLSTVNISALNSGTSGSTTIQLNQYRSGSLVTSSTATLASASGVPSGAAASLSGALSLLIGDVISVDVVSAAAGASDLTVEWEMAPPSSTTSCPLVEKTASYTLTDSDCTVVYTGTAAGIFTLKSAATAKAQLQNIKNASAYPLTVVSAGGSDTFEDGTTSVTINPGSAPFPGGVFQPNGVTKWYVH